MKLVFNTAHRGHAAQQEVFRGRLVPAFEVPQRADYIEQTLRDAGFGEWLPSQDQGLAPLARVHAGRYLAFLQSAWSQWLAEGGDAQTSEVFPAVWPVRSLRHDVEPHNFVARLGLYSMDSGSPLTAGTWAAAYAGAQATLTGLDAVLRGERAAYVLTRPPGHHAGADFFGGYCFVNNAAVAAQAARDRGLARVAILDVDYHHGNGTQAIFYDRADVFFASVHGDPMTEYPFYLGHADETGAGIGLGCNANFPLPAGADNAQWFGALGQALARIEAYAPALLIVSLGVDTSVEDPISHFKLETADFARIGALLAAAGLPTLLVQEGGYATAAIGRNVLAVLQGFESGARS